jgi:hypothetical protein
MAKTKQKRKRTIPESKVPKVISHRPPVRPPRVGEGGKWMPRVGN